jgi:methionine-rich copper-binding protein CopC
MMTLKSSRSIYFVSLTLVALALSMTTHAHAKLEKTTPADATTLTTAPTSIELVFNEGVDVKLTKIAVTGVSGKVALGPVHSMSEKSVMVAITGTVPDGKYSVAWQTSGDDGHVVKGEFGFMVKQAR